MVEADQRTTQEHERLVDVVAPLVADSEPAKLGQPRQSPLNHPPVPPQLLRTLYLLSRYAPLDATFSERPRTLLVVVGFVGVKLLGTLSRTAPRAFDGLDRVQKLLKDHRVIDVCGTRHHRERDAPSVDHNVALRARLSLIRRTLGPVFRPLFWPGHSRSPKRRAPTLSGRLLRDGRAELAGGAPIRPPLATRASAASRSPRFRSPSPGAASPKGCRSLARR